MLAIVLQILDGELVQNFARVGNQIMEGDTKIVQILNLVCGLSLKCLLVVQEKFPLLVSLQLKTRMY